tara:strand:- start:1491 stop:1901 length:411 start_codon:yes stop_codon:yes gene_type:complete
MRIFYLFFVLALYSCSAKYHYQKALKKGLEVTKQSDTIRISTIDSVPVIKHDTIVYEKFFSSKDTVIMYNNVYVPQTRLETRIEYKLKRDTLRLIKKVEVQKAKAAKRTCWQCFLIAILGLGLLVLVLFKLVQKYL